MMMMMMMMCVYCRYKSMVPKAITLLILCASYFVRYYMYRSRFFFTIYLTTLPLSEDYIASIVLEYS